MAAPFLSEVKFILISICSSASVSIGECGRLPEEQRCMSGSRVENHQPALQLTFSCLVEKDGENQVETEI